MQSLKSFEEVQDLVEHLVHRVVFVTPHHCIFESSSQSDAEKCVELLQDHSAYTVPKNGTWFVSIPL